MPYTKANRNKTIIPLSIGRPGGSGPRPGVGGLSVWATDIKPMKENKIETNIYL